VLLCEPLLCRSHILISLKRREEVLALRRSYGLGFVLVGVFATEDETSRPQLLVNGRF